MNEIEGVVESLANKYRPSTMDDYLDDRIKKIVLNRFSSPEKRPHVVFVYGDRGCGKTTFNRIIPKYYNCMNPKEDGSPCEECESCRDINENLIHTEVGMSIEGITEIDATKANGVEDVKRIIDEALQFPVYTKYKILIFDECHRLTPQAQNALLKLLEDIPNYLIILFATTDPQNVLQTIKSRCEIHIRVKKKSVDELAQRLLYISEQEGLEVSMEALKLIAKLNDRVPREAIGMLDDVAKTYNNKVTVDNVMEHADVIGQDLYVNFMEASRSSLEDILICCDKMKKESIDTRDFIKGFNRFALDSLYIRHGINLEDYTQDYLVKIKEIFSSYTSSEFDTLLQLLEDVNRSLTLDDTTNELILLNLGLKLGKLDFIAEGLGNEIVKAERENKISMNKYKEMIKGEEVAKIEKNTSINTTKEALSSILELTDITVGNNISIQASNDEDSIKKEDNGEGFFSLEELNRQFNS